MLLQSSFRLSLVVSCRQGAVMTLSCFEESTCEVMAAYTLLQSGLSDQPDQHSGFQLQFS